MINKVNGDMSQGSGNQIIPVSNADLQENSQTDLRDISVKISDLNTDKTQQFNRRPRTMVIIAKASLQFILMIAVLGISVFLMQNLIAGKAEPRKRPVFQSVFVVEAVTVALADHQPKFSVFGTIEASRNVELRALSSGEIIATNPKLKIGQRVNAGDTLVEIDRFEFEGALAEANANLAEVEARLVEKNVRIENAQSEIEGTRAQLEIAQSDLSRAQRLQENGTLNSKDVENRRLAVNERQLALTQRLNTIKVERAGIDQLKAQMERLTWRIAQAERALENTRLTAPFSGVVQNTNAEVGRNTNNNDVLVSLYDDNQLDVRFTLTDAQFGRLSADKRSALINRPVDVIWNVGGIDHVFKGRVARIGAQITTERGGIELFATLDPSSADISIRPGAFVEIKVPDLIFENSVKLPETTLYDGEAVYVLIDGKLQRRSINVLAYEGDEAIVRGDLKASERVLNTRLAQVSEGINVRTIDEPDPNAARSGKTQTSTNGGS